MPECYRCGRMQATAELRRTSLGYLCKENTRGTKCWAFAREQRMQERRRRTHELAETSEQLRFKGTA